MIGSIVDQSTFEELLTKTLPRVSSHLESSDVQIGMITQGWFICLFIGYLPLEVSKNDKRIICSKIKILKRLHFKFLICSFFYVVECYMLLD